MKRRPFTLVHGTSTTPSGGVRRAIRRIVKEEDWGAMISPPAQEFCLLPGAPWLGTVFQGLRALTRRVLATVLPEAARRPPPQRIGVWDLGAWLSGLNRLVEHLNAAQDTLVFFEVKATVPAGFISRPERMMAWLAERRREPLSDEDRKDIADNLVANDFFVLAEAIRKDLAIDYIVGITPSMVAGEEEGRAYWNYFSTYHERTVLASTHELRAFAQETEIPFEVYLGEIIVAEVLVAMSPELEYHDDRGCLFDFNEDRVGIKATTRNLKIEPACLELIRAPLRPAAEALVQLLRNYPKE